MQHLFLEKQEKCHQEVADHTEFTSHAWAIKQQLHIIDLLDFQIDAADLNIILRTDTVPYWPLQALTKDELPHTGNVKSIYLMTKHMAISIFTDSILNGY